MLYEPPGSPHPIALHGVTAYDPAGEAASTVTPPSTRRTTTPARAGTPSTPKRRARKPGVELVLDPREPVRLGSVTGVTDTPGFPAQIEAGTWPSGRFRVVSRTRTINGSTNFRLDAPQARYYMVWVTGLPAGRDAARVVEALARG